MPIIKCSSVAQVTSGEYFSIKAHRIYHKQITITLNTNLTMNFYIVTTFAVLLMIATTALCQSPCPSGLERCGEVCFDRMQYNCFDGFFLCPTSHYRCGNACYRPSQFMCGEGNILVPVYGRCNPGELNCNGSCYLPDLYECFQGYLCPKGTLRCGEACYSPSHFSCNGNKLEPV